MNYLDALRLVHETLKPGFYLEIGCWQGESLSLANCPSLAVDPQPELAWPLTQPTRLFKETSDHFFARKNVGELIGHPLDLALIDGMQDAQFALRDFVNLERHAHSGSVIVVRNILPRDIGWTRRTPQAGVWTGDVYKLIPLLRRERPDLCIEVFDIEKTGLALIHRLAPDDTRLADGLERHEAALEAGQGELGSAEDIRKALIPRAERELKRYVSDLTRMRPRRSTGSGSGALYLDLLKRSLLNEIYLDDELRLLYLRDCLNGTDSFDYAIYHDIRETRSEAYQALAGRRSIGQFPNRDIHLSGFSHTMIGRRRIDSLHECLDYVREAGIPGDFMECGVWRGGSCIFMAGYLKVHGMTGRQVVVADSFDGLPPPSHDLDLKARDLSKSKFPELAVSLATVRDNFQLYGLLSDRVTFLEGWFRDTLPKAPSGKLALLRLDGDLYESTMDALTNLYDRVSPGGVVVIDDFGGIPRCKQAVEDFFANRGETMPEATEIDWTGIWFTKPERAAGAGRGFDTAFPVPFLRPYQAGAMKYRYRGVPCLKSPIDMAIYARAIWDLQPKTVIEIGCKAGGSALWMADMLQSYGLDTPIYGIDLAVPDRPPDDRINFLKGDVNNLQAALSENDLLACPHPWFISEDSAHTYEGCRAALHFLAPHMEPGDLLVMEDGVLDDLGMTERYNGGPNRAIAEFLAERPGVFKIVTELCDMFGKNATYAPNGYLRKT